MAMAMAGRIRRLLLSPCMHNACVSAVRPSLRTATAAHMSMSAAAGAQQLQGQQPQKSKEADFIDKHGGKVFLCVVGAAGLWVWRWMQAKNDQRATEERLKDTAALEPNEINDIRLRNKVSKEEYIALAETLRGAFPSGRAHYTDFIRSTQQTLKQSADLANMHLFDRLVFSDERRGFPEGTESENVEQGVYALDFLLVALNILMNDVALERCKCLMSLLERQEDNMVPLQEVQRLLDCLMRTWQTPVEKMVVETGKHIPYSTHRRATAEEVCARAMKELKLNPEPPALSEETLTSLLLSNSVCAWGECYRSKKT